jgi:solute carrier family 50 protein (sugar transporter)
MKLQLSDLITQVSNSPTMSFWVQLCSQTAPMAAIVVFAAPIPTILKIMRDRSVGDLPLLPYSSMLSSAFVWVAYGILKNESKIWSSNGVGLVFGLVYFLIFTKYCPPQSSTLPGSVLQHMQGTAGFIFLCLILATWVGVQMVGNLGVILCVCMFASPLAALKVVLQTRSAKAIPLPFTLASVLNCFLWSVAGLFDMHDYAIYVPNLLGLSFGLAQVGLKLVYGSGSSESMLPTKSILTA